MEEIGFSYDDLTAIGFRYGSLTAIGFRYGSLTAIGFRYGGLTAIGFRYGSLTAIGFRYGSLTAIGFRDGGFNCNWFQIWWFYGGLEEYGTVHGVVLDANIPISTIQRHVIRRSSVWVITCIQDVHSC